MWGGGEERGEGDEWGLKKSVVEKEENKTY